MSGSFDGEYEDETRRGKLQLIRDILLSLEIEGRPMKPTLLMYSVRLNWSAMKDILKGMSEKHLIELVEPERSRRGRVLDKRSNTRISTTLKGKYLLRILDEMLRYLEDEMPPQVNPPLWLMRKALELKGFDFMGELKEMQNLNLLEAPTLLEDPTPPGSYLENPGEDAIPLKPASAPESEVLFTLTAVNPELPIRDYSPYNKAKEVAASFFVVNRDVEDVKVGKTELHCPECGKAMSGLRALSIHVGRMHKEKKKEIMAQVHQFQSKVA